VDQDYVPASTLPDEPYTGWCLVTERAGYWWAQPGTDGERHAVSFEDLLDLLERNRRRWSRLERAGRLRENRWCKAHHHSWTDPSELRESFRVDPDAAR
jgi:hypothetical protein